MIRRLALFAAPLALLGLSACDVPQALVTAKPGDCFAVVGKQANGAPKWEKTECSLDTQAVVTPIQPEGSSTNADGTTTTAANGAAKTTAGACPAVPVVCPPAVKTATASTPRAKANFWNRKAKSNRQVATRSRGNSSSRSGEVGFGEYQRVYTPDYPTPAPLAGGYREDNHVSTDNNFYREERRYSYNPPAPPPPAPRYEQRQQHEQYSYGYGERVAPPPPPVYRAPPPPPQLPPCRTGCPSGGRSGYSAEYSQSQRSYSASSSSSGGSYGGGYSSGCNSGCGGGRGSTMAPMNGPHFPVDRDGYLTWRGKTR